MFLSIRISFLKPPFFICNASHKEFNPPEELQHTSSFHFCLHSENENKKYDHPLTFQVTPLKENPSCTICEYFLYIKTACIIKTSLSSDEKIFSSMPVIKIITSSQFPVLNFKRIYWYCSSLSALCEQWKRCLWTSYLHEVSQVP